MEEFNAMKTEYKEQPSPTKGVEHLKLYPAGGSRDYQYKQLCEQLATELEAVQKESMELLAENAENAELTQLRKVCDELAKDVTGLKALIIEIPELDTAYLKDAEIELLKKSNLDLQTHSLLPHVQAKKGTT